MSFFGSCFLMCQGVECVSASALSYEMIKVQVHIR